MISVVIPIYNEEANIPELHTRLSPVLERLCLDSGQPRDCYEIILVDDGSRDRSWNLIRELHERDKRVKGVTFARNFGHHIALTAGLDHCSGSAVILMDGDLQDPPEEIPRMYELFGGGYDLVDPDLLAGDAVDRGGGGAGAGGLETGSRGAVATGGVAAAGCPRTVGGRRGQGRDWRWGVDPGRELGSFRGKRWFWMAMWILALPAALWAQQKRPGDAVSLDKVEVRGAAKAGGTVTAVVHFKIEKGYHTHSHQPSEPNFIPTVLSVASTNGVKAGPVKYPAGKAEVVEGLAKPLSVYDGQFQVEVPLTLEGGAKLPMVVPATLSYQACKGPTCFPPKKLKVELTVK